MMLISLVLWLILAVCCVPINGALAWENNLKTDFGSWSFETSGGVESIIKSDIDWKFVAGGEVAGTHYSRVKYKLPERYGNSLTSFYTKEVIELPADFYTKQKAGFRIINTDNYGTVVNGKSYGSSDANELRAAVYINSQHYLQVVIDYETKERIVLWSRNEPLPVGLHTVEFFGDVAVDAPWGLIVDGVELAFGNIKLSPESVPVGERVITRIVGGIDGAADQDNNSMELMLRDIYISDKRPSIIVTPVPTGGNDCAVKTLGDTNCDGVVDLADFLVWKNEYLGIVTTRKGDFDNSGVVDLADFSIWKTAYLSK